MILGIPWPGINLPILGVAPVLFLMFFVRPAAQRTSEPRIACSKCASPHTLGQNFCTKCGWDLTREYTPETTDTVLASDMHHPQASSTATLERPSEPAPTETGIPSEFAPEQPSPTATVIEEQPAPEVFVEGAEAESTTDEAAASAKEDSALDKAGELGTEAPDRPWGIPVPGPAPTAEGMTARGAALLSEGKLQEAIDQFTKAIALDPRHREALEHRADAYKKQGRQDRADEDYRQVQALNTSS